MSTKIHPAMEWSAHWAKQIDPAQFGKVMEGLDDNGILDVIQRELFLQQQKNPLPIPRETYDLMEPEVRQGMPVAETVAAAGPYLQREIEYENMLCSALWMRSSTIVSIPKADVEEIQVAFSVDASKVVMEKEYESLPFADFYLDVRFEIDGGSFLGFFVHYDRGHGFLIRGLVESRGGMGYFSPQRAFGEWVFFDNKPDVYYIDLDTYRQVFSILRFLSHKNVGLARREPPDFNFGTPSPHENRRARQKREAKETALYGLQQQIQMWGLGCRVGAALQAAAEEPSSEGTGTGSSKCPHTRKAHEAWRRCGKGRTQWRRVFVKESFIHGGHGPATSRSVPKRTT
jgi:hypothetical protein